MLPAVLLIAGIGGLVFFPRQIAAAVQQVGEVAKKVYGPFQLYGPPMPSTIEATALSLARQNLEKREGYENYVYVDTAGYATVGIGHKVLPEDNLRVGQYVSDAQIAAFFEKDVAKAFSAAKSQALELRKYNADMIAALISVNFQLGTGWRKTFANTWNDLKTDNVQGAIIRLQSSVWRKQTPTRVADFIAAIERNFA